MQDYEFFTISQNTFVVNKHYISIAFHDLVEKVWQPAIVICKMSKFWVSCGFVALVGCYPMNIGL